MKRSILMGVALMAALAMVGCTSVGSGSTDTPAKKVFAATSVYNGALTAAVTYKRLPSCEKPDAPAICSDKSVVATLQRADDVAAEALKSAQNVVRNPSASQSSLNAAVLWAQEAAQAFGRIAGSLKLKE